MGSFGEGLHAIRLIAENGGGDLGASEFRYFIVDTTSPDVTVNIVDSSLSDGDRTSNVTINFDEPVTGFTIDDVSAFNGMFLNDFTGSGSSYTVTFRADENVTGNGSVTVGTGYTDLSGNTGTGDSDNVSIDTRNPTADIVDVDPDLRITGVGTVTVNFSEAVTGVGITDFSLTRNGSAVSLSGVTVSGSGSSRTLTNLSSKNSSSGTYVLTLNASGSGIVDSAGNALAGNATDDWRVDATDPTISNIANRTINEGSNTGVISFTVNDAETSASSLDVSRGSSDEALVRVEKIVLAGSGASRTVTVTPETDGNGSATITLTVTDGVGRTDSETFDVTVRPVND
ncbi:MAG: Ig-like domain-containing protein [Planctomycetota bacterium]|nr:Ig-like domain-containing protein [Planctomycetota bacterium]